MSQARRTIRPLSRASWHTLASAAVGLVVLGAAVGCAAGAPAARAGPTLGGARHDWPCWYGPNGNFSAADCGRELVDDLAQAKLLWRSEERPPPAAPAIGAGGGASPIVYKGRVYLCYFVPSGEIYPDFVHHSCPKRFRLDPSKLGDYDPWSLTAAQRKRLAPWRIGADDVLLCLDAASGRTLWRRAYNWIGLNWFGHKETINNLTPCAFGGRVFFMDSIGRLHCLDAATGREHWWRPVPRFAESMRHMKQVGLSTLSLVTPNRSNNHALACAEGVVVAPDDHANGRDCGLVGFDSETGKVLWHLGPQPNGRHAPILGALATPLRWVHGGREYLVAASSQGHIRCIEPRTGRVLWTVTDAGANDFQPALAGDHLIVHIMGHAQRRRQAQEHERKRTFGHTGLRARDPVYVPIGQVGCYRLRPTGAERVWELPREYGAPWFKATAVVHRGIAYLRLSRKMIAVEVATGKVVVEEPSVQHDDEAHAYAADGRLFVEPDSQHGHSTTRMFLADPKAWRQLGGQWDPPHPHTTSYQTPIAHPVVDGRLYMRGADGIYCYDLRKAPPPQAAPEERIEGLAATMEEPVRKLASQFLSRRNEGIGELARLADPSAVLPAVATLAAEGNWLERAAACEALQRLGPRAKAAAPALRGALNAALMGRDAEAAKLMMSALAKVDPQVAAAQAKALATTLSSANGLLACQTLAAAGPAAKAVLPQLALALRSSDRRVAAQAAEAIGGLKAQAAPAVSALAGALKSGDREVARAAAEALLAIGPAAEPAVPALIDLLKRELPKRDPRRDKVLLMLAVRVLQTLGEKAEPAAPVLVQTLYAVRHAAAQALRRIGPAAVPVILEELKASASGKDTRGHRWRRERLSIPLRMLGRRAVPALEAARRAARGQFAADLDDLLHQLTSK